MSGEKYTKNRYRNQNECSVFFPVHISYNMRPFVSTTNHIHFFIHFKHKTQEVVGRFALKRIGRESFQVLRINFTIFYIYFFVLFFFDGAVFVILKLKFRRIREASTTKYFSNKFRSVISTKHEIWIKRKRNLFENSMRTSFTIIVVNI